MKRTSTLTWPQRTGACHQIRYTGDVEKRQGFNIYLSSIDAIVAPYSKTVPYSVTKAGLHKLTRTTASNHWRDGIRSNCIAPGHVQGAFPSGSMTEQLCELRKNTAPIGTEGKPWDVALLAMFLASDESARSLVQLFPVDVGLLVLAPLKAYSFLTGLEL